MLTLFLLHIKLSITFFTKFEFFVFWVSVLRPNIYLEYPDNLALYKWSLGAVKITEYFNFKLNNQNMKNLKKYYISTIPLQSGCRTIHSSSHWWIPATFSITRKSEWIHYMAYHNLRISLKNSNHCHRNRNLCQWPIRRKLLPMV